MIKFKKKKLNIIEKYSEIVLMIAIKNTNVKF